MGMTLIAGVATDRTGSAVFDAVDVAVMVRVPAGDPIGAVNVVGLPLLVWLGLKLPVWQ
jgi:hypothetical protein